MSKQRRINVDVTSWRHIDVDAALFHNIDASLFRRQVSAGLYTRRVVVDSWFSLYGYPVSSRRTT